MTNWLIIKRKEQLKAENCAIVKETLKATLEDKEKLDQDLNLEIATLSNNLAKKTFKKQAHKDEAQRLAGELKTTQESLNDANNKATNEKIELAKELKALNEKLGNPLTPIDEDIEKQLDAIKGRLNHILEVEGRDVQTVLEARQRDYINYLKNDKLLLTPEERQAINYAAGYYYWHEQGNHTQSKADKEKLEQYLIDYKDDITDKAVLFTVSIVLKHYDEEEKHSDDNHTYLGEVAKLNNKYAELEIKYKDKEKELVDAQDKLTLTEKDKQKLSDQAIKDIADLNNDIKQLGETYSENYKKFTDTRDDLIKKIDNLKDQLKKKVIDAKTFGVEFWALKKKVQGLEAEARLSTTEKIKKLAMSDGQLSNFGKDIWENLTKTLTELGETQSKSRQKKHAERFKEWLSSFEAEYKNIFEALGTTEREREREH